MTNSDDDTIFLDTNVLVYAGVSQSPLHQTALQAIQDFYNTGVELWISQQVLREYLATLSRPQVFAVPQVVSTLVADVRQLQDQFRVAQDSPQVMENLLSLLEEVDTAGKQVHDANIVATMQAYGIPQLLTHNITDFTRFSEFITVIPLVAQT